MKNGDMRKKGEISKIFELTKDYMGKWVILSADYKKVVASGETLKEARANLPRKRKKMMIFKVPWNDLYFTPILD